jgi:hypothetical protein
MLSTTTVALYQKHVYSAAFRYWPVLEMGWMKAGKYHAMTPMEQLKETSGVINVLG